MFVCLLSQGPEAALPIEEAQEFQTIEVSDELFKELQEVEVADVKDDLKEDTQKKKKMKRKITHGDVLQEQYRALIAKQENLKIKKRKLELEVFLLEQRMCSIPAQVSINVSP